MPLRTSRCVTTVRPRRGLKGGDRCLGIDWSGVATERCVPKGYSPAEITKKEAGRKNRSASISLSADNYPPKLSYMIEAGSTPRLSSIPVTAFDMGPGPHM